MVNSQKDSLIKTLVQSIKDGGINSFIEKATYLYATDVRCRLNYQDFYHRTNRATNPLISVDEAVYYSSTFTREHLDRFYYVLGSLGTKAIFAQKITVVDYGCGQGLATLAFLQYLKENNCIANKVIDIHLVEPSVVTSVMARQFVLAMAKYTGICVNVMVHQKTLAQYLENPVALSCPFGMTLHFLSNVLDIEKVQSHLPQLSAYINQQEGQQYICAVSSHDYHRGFNTFSQGLTDFDVAYHHAFSIQSYRFHSNRCVWHDKQAKGRFLYVQKVA